MSQQSSTIVPALVVQVKKEVEPWRMDILSHLSRNNEQTSKQFPAYEHAIERTSWAKKEINRTILYLYCTK
jgi:hypothetical protein